MNNSLIAKISQDLSLDINLIRNILLREDKRFLNHCGLDFIRIIGATLVNIKYLKIQQGASTITQQIYDIKQQNISLKYNRKRNIARKIKQILFALKYETTHSKEEIYKYYLENIYLGNAIFGFKNACKFYFHKNGTNLTEKEINFLIQKIQKPCSTIF